MVALKIDEIGAFTAKLFIGTEFDGFLVREVNIVTYNSFTIDGHIRQGYYTEEELEQNHIEEMSSWQTLKPFCYSLIKGKKLPGSFQITLQLAPAEVGRFLTERGLNLAPEQIGGIYMNIRYEDQVLYCISGTSLNVFTLDKSLDREWDDAMRTLLRRHQIVFTEDSI